jgi:hypothetical protein
MVCLLLVLSISNSSLPIIERLLLVQQENREAQQEITGNNGDTEGSDERLHVPETDVGRGEIGMRDWWNELTALQNVINMKLRT